MLAFLGSFMFIGIMMFVNFGISWWNAKSVGRIWSESKAIGGGTRALAISGYVMAIAGFTSVYVTILMIILGTVGPSFGLDPYVAETLLGFVGDLSYFLIIMAIIPTGLVIWINSLITFWKHKNLRSGGVALWNTIATASNMINAARNVPSAVSGIKRVLSNNDRGSGNIIILGIIIVLAAILGGYFTASTIMHREDRKYDLVEAVTGQKLA